MSDKTQTGYAAGSAADWSNLWQSMAESSNRMVEAWSGSIAPFMMSRVSEKTTGEVNDLSAAIERMAQGPQLADVWDFDRKLALAFGAWIQATTPSPRRRGQRHRDSSSKRCRKAKPSRSVGATCSRNGLRSAIRS